MFQHMLDMERRLEVSHQLLRGVQKHHEALVRFGGSGRRFGSALCLAEMLLSLQKICLRDLAGSGMWSEDRPTHVKRPLRALQDPVLRGAPGCQKRGGKGLRLVEVAFRVHGRRAAALADPGRPGARERVELREGGGWGSGAE